jgi:hypothetical protein
VVTETDSHTSGWARRISATTVLLPTPDGPERTVRRLDGIEPPAAGTAESAAAGEPPRPSGASRSAISTAAELTLQSGALVGAKAPHAAGLGDTEPLHDLLSANLSDARQGFQQSRHLHLSDYVVGLTIFQNLSERGSAVLQAVFDLGTLFAGLGSLLQGCGALFRG